MAKEPVYLTNKRDILTNTKNIIITEDKVHINGMGATSDDNEVESYVEWAKEKLDTFLETYKKDLSPKVISEANG